MKNQKMKILSFLTMLILLAATSISGTVTTFAAVPEADDYAISLSNESTVEVFSYKTILQAYYDVVLEETEKAGIKNICTFDDFCYNYYSLDMDLPSFTDALILYYIYGIELSEDPPVTPMASSDEDYILSPNDYATTPASEFRRVPVRNIYDYSALQAGDIIHETDTILKDIGHTALIYDMSKNSAHGSYIQTIEAVKNAGVTFGFLDDKRMVDFGVVILRVIGITASHVSTAKSFCYQQLWKPWSFDVNRTNTSISSSTWLCSEMIYAAFKYAGRDLYCINQYGSCMPDDIFKSYNTDFVHFSGFLDIMLISKSGGNWTIKVVNKGNSDIACTYNTKMCFENDAKNWKNLKHTVGITVYAGSSETVVISQNAFATSIAFSRVLDKIRHVTYGKGLNNERMEAKKVFTAA